MKEKKKNNFTVFITLYSFDGGNIFGEIADGHITLSPAGEVAVKWAVVLGDEFGVRLEAFTVMPNHMHLLVDSGSESAEEKEYEKFTEKMALWFMNMTSEEMKAHGIMSGEAWKKEYSCHVLENETGLEHAREHISKDPAHWHDEGHKGFRSSHI